MGLKTQEMLERTDDKLLVVDYYAPELKMAAVFFFV